MATHARRASVLREMGLGPIWRLRSNDAAEAEEGAETIVPPVEATPAAPARPASATVDAGTPVPRATTSRQLPAREAMAAAAAAAMEPAVRVPDSGRMARIATFDWTELEEDIRGCQACVLCERRKQAVPGVGDRRAELMLVGEGPGAEEDQRGEPFVGQAGKLLDNMLAAIGMKRGEGVYIANAVKCRPPHNRTPEAGEIAACLPYLERQIALVNPRLLVALGRPAAQALLQAEIAIGAARGKRLERGGVPVVVTYHPAYLLRNPQDKAKAWEDLCFVRRSLAELRKA